MNPTVSRTTLQLSMRAAFDQPDRLARAAEAAEFPADLESWLHNLQLLKGVPFNYLVPDEAMLPPESIRFFYLDLNWLDALVDGAFSIGRNLTADVRSPMMALDAATSPVVNERLRANGAQLRARNLGQVAPVTTMKPVTGFVLRSSLVPAYPGMGVYAYDENQKMLDILRFERFGADSDAMLCLVDGEALQIDIHEAPEALHYGVDEYSYDPATQKVKAQKSIHPFTVAKDGKVTLEKTVKPVDISDCFRLEDPRTVRVAKLAATLLPVADPAIPYLNAALMGFEMTQGVGLVSFTKKLVKS